MNQNRNLDDIYGMKILGVHDGHNASATLVIDGKLVASKAEERLSRVKHHYGCPMKAIQKVLAIGGIEPTELDGVAMATSTHYRLPISLHREIQNFR